MYDQVLIHNNWECLSRQLLILLSIARGNPVRIVETLKLITNVDYILCVDAMCVSSLICYGTG